MAVIQILKDQNYSEQYFTNACATYIYIDNVPLTINSEGDLVDA